MRNPERARNHAVREAEQRVVKFKRFTKRLASPVLAASLLFVGAKASDINAAEAIGNATSKIERTLGQEEAPQPLYDEVEIRGEGVPRGDELKFQIAKDGNNVVFDISQMSNQVLGDGNPEYIVLWRTAEEYQDGRGIAIKVNQDKAVIDYRNYPDLFDPETSKFIGYAITVDSVSTPDNGGKSEWAQIASAFPVNINSIENNQIAPEEKPPFEFEEQTPANTADSTVSAAVDTDPDMGNIEPIDGTAKTAGQTESPAVENEPATPSPTSTPSPTETATTEPTATHTATSTPIPTETPTPEPTATHTATATPHPTETATSEPTATWSPESTVTPTSTNASTEIPTQTPMVEPTMTATSPPALGPIARTYATETPPASAGGSDSSPFTLDSKEKRSPWELSKDDKVKVTEALAGGTALALAAGAATGYFRSRKQEASSGHRPETENGRPPQSPEQIAERVRNEIVKEWEAMLQANQTASTSTASPSADSANITPFPSESGTTPFPLENPGTGPGPDDRNGPTVPSESTPFPPPDGITPFPPMGARPGREPENNLDSGNEDYNPRPEPNDPGNTNEEPPPAGRSTNFPGWWKLVQGNADANGNNSAPPDKNGPPPGGEPLDPFRIPLHAEAKFFSNIDSLVGKLTPKRLENLAGQYDELPEEKRRETDAFVSTDHPGPEFNEWVNKYIKAPEESTLQERMISFAIKSLPQKWPSLSTEQRQAMLQLVQSGRYEDMLQETASGNPNKELKQAILSAGALVSSQEDAITRKASENYFSGNINRWIRDNRYRHVPAHEVDQPGYREATNHALQQLKNAWQTLDTDHRQRILKDIANGTFARNAFKARKSGEEIYFTQLPMAMEPGSDPDTDITPPKVTVEPTQRSVSANEDVAGEGVPQFENIPPQPIEETPIADPVPPTPHRELDRSIGANSRKTPAESFAAISSVNEARNQLSKIFDEYVLRNGGGPQVNDIIDEIIAETGNNWRSLGPEQRVEVYRTAQNGKLIREYVARQNRDNGQKTREVPRANNPIIHDLSGSPWERPLQSTQSDERKELVGPSWDAVLAQYKDPEHRERLDNSVSFRPSSSRGALRSELQTYIGSQISPEAIDQLKGLVRHENPFLAVDSKSGSKMNRLFEELRQRWASLSRDDQSTIIDHIIAGNFDTDALIDG